MGTFNIRKGRNIRLKGEARKEVIDLPLPKRVAVQPPDFQGLKPRLAVKVDDLVKVGSPIIADKGLEGLRILSPASGKIVAINRGEKRALLDIVIETDGKQDSENFRKFSEGEIRKLSREVVVKHLLEGGLWASVIQRPFSKIANLKDKPKSIFIHAMTTEPLGLDVDLVLAGRDKQFQLGLDIIAKLTDGDVHLCAKEGATSKSLTESQGVSIHKFSGPHPAGNVGTHIHCIDPINKGDIVWYVEAQDVLRIASLFLDGVYPTERVVAVTGEGARNRLYMNTVMGASLLSLLEDSDLDNMRCLTGSVLTGRDIGQNGFVGYYDSQICVIPEGGKRELFGWLGLGINKYSFSKTWLSSFLPQRNYSLNTDKNGSDRAIVLNNVYDSLVALDVVTYFLLRAVISGDIEEAEKLGILECADEDFALCSFACPSKTDVGGVIREGLRAIEAEG